MVKRVQRRRCIGKPGILDHDDKVGFIKRPRAEFGRHMRIVRKHHVAEHGAPSGAADAETALRVRIGEYGLVASPAAQHGRERIDELGAGA
jgi:hypothetical protein